MSLTNVHSASFISDCDVQLLCSMAWTLPYMVSSGDPDVFISEDSYKYTKEKTKISCAVCLEKLKAKT